MFRKAERKVGDVAPRANALRFYALAEFNRTLRSQTGRLPATRGEFKDRTTSKDRTRTRRPGEIRLFATINRCFLYVSAPDLGNGGVEMS